MPDIARKILGGLLTTALVVAGFSIIRTQSTSYRTIAAQQVRSKTLQKITQLKKAFEAEATQLALRVESGAKTLNPIMRHAVVIDEATRTQLAATIVDVITNEAWWVPYRALGQQLFFLGGQLVTHNADEAVKVVQPLVSDAETSGSAAALVQFQGRIVLAAAGRVPTPNLRQERGVVVILRPIDQAFLSKMATQVGGTVAVISTAETKVAGGNTASLQAYLAANRPASTVNCAVQSVGADLELAVSVNAQPFYNEAAQKAKDIRMPVFIVVALCVIGVLVFTFRKSAHSTQEQLLREAAAQLQMQQTELKRLSQEMRNSTINNANNAERPSSSPGITMTADDAFAATSVSPVQSRYEVVAPLGQGGMAKVAVAVVRGAEGFRRLFVVKRLKAELASAPELVNQFIDEARLGASLVHSNIVPVFDFGRDAEGYFMAQEYILGRDVDAVVRASMKKRGHALEIPLVLAIAHEALQALSYAHSKTDDANNPLGLVHRDVSPSNLMVTAGGEVKLLDFGIVKSEQRLTQTQTGIVKGNLFFMSPEQAKGLPLDARSDLFSLGLVLYYAATGRTLYGTGTGYELLTRAAQGVLEADMERINALPEPLTTVIRKALTFNPAQRYSDADDFARVVAATGQVARATDMKLLIESLLQEELAEEQTRFSLREHA